MSIFAPWQNPESEAGGTAVDERGTILVVDDDQTMAEVLAHRLHRVGYEVEAVGTGTEALAAARRRPPRLILLDVGLPDASGFEVAQELADDPLTCGVPLIFLTGTDDPQALRQARACGGAFFLRKPYDPNALLVLIQSALADSAG